MPRQSGENQDDAGLQKGDARGASPQDANPKLVAIFQQMADVTELLGGDRFRVNAFAKAARVIGELAEDLGRIWHAGGEAEKALTDLDGIGKGTAARIAEFIRTGRIEDHRKLMAQVPVGLPDLLDVPGLGPKTVALLWKEAGIEGLDDLKEKLKDDSLADLPGLGKKKLDNLRKSLAFAESAGGRIRLGQAMPLARWIVDRLRQVKGVKQADYAGSLRRGRETIGDLDILVAADAKHAADITSAFTGLPVVADVLVSGKTKTSVRLKAERINVQADLRIVEPDCYGAALMYFTGSKEHNVALRRRAMERGLTLNEYALATEGDKQPVAAKTEQDIYDALDMDFIAPELREDRGEIALAARRQLPELIDLKDIAAELHAHTTASDGIWSIRELAMCAIDRGFHTVAITDHSKSQVQANGLSEQRLEAHIAAVRQVAKELADKIQILAGSEVDILADGKLDYPNSLLKQLDLVVASPHSALSQDADKATTRLLRAIDNPYVTIVGHPTGRLINRRPGLNPDIKRVAHAAAQRGIALEVNANSWRLDLRDTHAAAAIDAGARLSINTDAHGPSDLDQLTFGLLTARRAGATRGDVINTLSKAAFNKWLKATRG